MFHSNAHPQFEEAPATTNEGLKFPCDNCAFVDVSEDNNNSCLTHRQDAKVTNRHWLTAAAVEMAEEVSTPC